MPAETPAQERAWQAAKATEAKRLEEEQKQVTPIELKKEEYETFATEYVAPILLSIKEPERPSDIIYQQAEEMQQLKKLYGFPKMTVVLQVFGGIVEAGESVLEIVFPHPLPAPARPQTAARYMGIIAGSLITGKVAGWILEPGITPAAQHYLTKQYLKKGPLEWIGWKEKLVMRLTGVRPYVAPGVVSVPTGAIIPSHEVYGEIWRWGLESKQALLFTEKAIAPVTKELPMYFIRGTAMVPMALKQMEAVYKPMPYGYAEPWKRVPSPISGGLPMPQVTELAKPFMEVGLPYLPEAVSVAPKGLSSLLGIGLALLPKALPLKVAMPKLETIPTLKPQIFEEPYPIQKSKLFPQAYPRQREKQIPILMPKLSLKPLSRAALRLEIPQISRQKEKLASMTALKLEAPQMTKQVQMLKMAMPTPLLQKQILRLPAYPRIPSMREPSFKRFGKGLFGKWFKREHAIPTERQIMRSLGLRPSRKRTKPRGTRRRRR